MIFAKIACNERDQIFALLFSNHLSYCVLVHEFKLVVLLLYKHLKWKHFVNILQVLLDILATMTKASQITFKAVFLVEV